MTQYRIYRNVNGAGLVLYQTLNGAPPTNSYTDAAVANGSTYSYAVDACDASGNCSAQSAASTTVTADNAAPTTPAAPTITNLAANSLTVNWVNPGDNVAVTAYRVFRNGVQIATTNAATFSFNDSGLVSATLYSYSVAACDASGNCSAPSASVNVTTLDNVPPTVPGSGPITTAIAAGAYHALALKFDGTVVAWGRNVEGQSTVPGGLTGVTAVAAGANFSLALKSDTTVVAWGSNISGQSTVPGGLTGVTAVAAGTNHSLALKSDGTVVAWGDNSQGQSAVPGGLTGVVAIAAGLNHSLALKSDGTVVAWGDNSQGQSAVPGGLSNVVAISAGASHSLAAKSDGTVVAWGRNVEGQSTVPGGLSGVANVAAGGFNSLARKSDGTIVTWGDNSQGQSTVPAALIVAQGFTATAVSATQVNVAWTASTDNVAVTAYQVFRNGVFLVTVNAPTLTYSDTGLVSATLYTYTVAACDAAGNCSAQTAPVAVTTPDNVPPSVPAGLNITNLAGNSLTLNWTAATDNVAVATYVVSRDGVFRATVNAPAVSFNDTGLISATAYSYTVAACDAVGNCSAQSSTVSATTPDNVPPSVPAGLNITNLGANSLTLNWSASTDNVAVTAYQVFRDGVQIATTNAATLSFDDSGLITVTLYVYAVKACDAAGNCSAQSAPVSTITLDNLPPTVPLALAATAVTQSQINLSWTASTDNVGVFSYQIYRDGLLFTTIGAPATTYANTGLAAATTYTYRIAACDAAGNCSAQSVAAAATTPDTQAPTVPTGLTATGVSTSQINVSWTASTDNVAVTAYRLFRNGVFVATVNAPTVSFSDTGLAASTSYSYAVAACDAAGNCSAQSAAAIGGTFTVFTPSITTPGFNLMGNGLGTTLDIVAIFGNQDTPTAVTPNVVSIWKWNPTADKWAFYSPQLTAADNAAYVADPSRNYDLLTTVNPGEGYWVNAGTSLTLPAQTGALFTYDPVSFATLTPGGTSVLGWYLIAISNSVTPSQFNLQVTPGTPVGVPTSNFLSLWLWDPAAQKWYFYAPILEATGGLAAVQSYANAHGFLHFQDFGKTLGLGAGFWVNRP